MPVGRWLHDVTLDGASGRVRSYRRHDTGLLVRGAVDVFAGDVREASTLIPIRVVGMPDVDATWRRDGAAATCSLSHDGIPVVMMLMLGVDVDEEASAELIDGMPLAGAGLIDVADRRLTLRPLLVCVPLVSAILAGAEVVALCGDISTCIAAAWVESFPSPTSDAPR